MGQARRAKVRLFFRIVNVPSAWIYSDLQLYGTASFHLCLVSILPRQADLYFYLPERRIHPFPEEGQQPALTSSQYISGFDLVLEARGISHQVRGKDRHIAWSNYHTRDGCPVGACNDIVALDLGVPLVPLDAAR